MTHVVVLGGGLGGAIAAFELRETLDRSTKITVVSKGDVFQFTPSNPWVAVGWRKPKDIEVNLARVLARRGVEHIGVGAAKVRPESNAVDLLDGRTLAYDYLVIATGPHLAFDEIEGMGPGGHTQSVCTTEHAAQAGEAFEAYCKNPGPIMVGAAQGASCFGPAYEFALILDTELKRRKIRHKAPMTFVTSEPYIGHLGLDGVGDTKGLLESVLRDRDIRWITNARVRAFGPNSASVEEVGDDGAPKKIHDVQYNYAMMLPAFRGVEAVAGVPGLVNPRGFVLVDRQQRNPTFPNVFAVGVCVAIPPTGQTPVPVGVPKTGFMIESMVTATAQNIKALIAGRAGRRSELERGLHRRFRRRRRRLRRAAANSAAQRELVRIRKMGALRKDRFREIFPAQNQKRQIGAVLRALRA